MMKAKSIILVCFPVVFLLSGCMTMKEFHGLVASKLEHDYVQPVKIQSAHVTLNADKLQKFDSLVVVNKKSSYFIPAIFFWNWDRTYKFEIDKSFFVNIFAKSLNERLKTYDLNNYLKSRKLEISIDKVPNSYLYSNTGVVLFFFAYIYTYSETVSAVQPDFDISYKILKNGIVVKKDTFIYHIPEPTTNNDYSSMVYLNKSMNQLINDYKQKVDDYIDRIIDDL